MLNSEPWMLIWDESPMELAMSLLSKWEGSAGPTVKRHRQLVACNLSREWVRDGWEEAVAERVAVGAQRVERLYGWGFRTGILPAKGLSFPSGPCWPSQFVGRMSGRDALTT